MIDQQKRRLIYLTGFMGSGKTTIAPILANTIGYSFVDIDREIENAVGKSVSEIFSDLGEGYFREIERSILTELSAREGCVISLGGGTIANELNLKLVKSTGILVYLKVSSDHIVHRLRHKTDRPLLKSKERTTLTESELHRRVAQLLAQREPFYNQADITVTTEEQIGVTIDEIVRCLKQFER